MSRFLLVVAFILSGCARHAPQEKAAVPSRFTIERFDDDHFNVYVIRDNNTSKDYLAVYNVGILEMKP